MPEPVPAGCMLLAASWGPDTGYRLLAAAWQLLAAARCWLLEAGSADARTLAVLAAGCWLEGQTLALGCWLLVATGWRQLPAAAAACEVRAGACCPTGARAGRWLRAASCWLEADCWLKMLAAGSGRRCRRLLAGGCSWHLLAAS